VWLLHFFNQLVTLTERNKTYELLFYHAYALCCAVDEMGSRIDDLEKTMNELMQMAGVEEEELKNSSSTATTSSTGAQQSPAADANRS